MSSEARSKIRIGLEHDDVVQALQAFYQAKGMHTRIGPATAKESIAGARYIDLIVANRAVPDEFNDWPIEVETAATISPAEARSQWRTYDQIFNRWFLAVPIECVRATLELMYIHGIMNCTTITWYRDSLGQVGFHNLPER